MLHVIWRGVVSLAATLRSTRGTGVFGGAGVLLCAGVAAAQQRQLGVDVSHFQAENGISQASWNAMRADGKEFAWIKATEGLLPPGNVDPAWQNNVTRASAAGIRAGVYHFGRPDNRPTVAGAIQEAGHFVATAGSAMGAGNLRPVLDLERGNALSTGELTDWVLAFVNEVVNLKGPAAEPIVYTSLFYATFEVDSRVANLDCWLRDLNGQNPQTGAPSTTGQFNNWTAWQYSQTGSSGGISPLDLDVIHSEYKPLSALVVPDPATLAPAAFSSVWVVGQRRWRRLPRHSV